MPWIVSTGNAALLFVVVGVAFWQYGGGLSLMPAMTADFFGVNKLGLKYGLVFIGWGIAFCVPQLAGYIKDVTGGLDAAFYLSGAILISAILLSRVMSRPLTPAEKLKLAGDLHRGPQAGILESAGEGALSE